MNEEELVEREEATDSYIDSNFSASARKLKNNMEDDIDCSRSFTHKELCFFDIMIFINLIQEIGRCLLCDTKLDVNHDLAGRMGLCNFFYINCSSEICDWSKRVATSDYIDKDVGSAQNPYVINLGSVVASREMGKGHRAMETFCGFMNMPPPMTKKSCHKCIDDIHSLYMKCAANFMKQVADELRGFAAMCKPCKSSCETGRK